MLYRKQTRGADRNVNGRRFQRSRGARGESPAPKEQAADLGRTVVRKLTDQQSKALWDNSEETKCDKIW